MPGLNKFQIPNSKFQKRGFTLVEMLVVLGLLALSVGSALLILTSVLKGSNQATVSAEVKQNGQAILDSLERQIRNAESVMVEEVDGTGKVIHIKLTRPDTDPLHIKCYPSTVSTNGWIGTVVNVSDLPADSTFVSVSNKGDLVSGVDVQACYFSIQAGVPPAPAIVSVNFEVNQGINAPSRQDFVARVPFRTTISLRNYQ